MDTLIYKHKYIHFIYARICTHNYNQICIHTLTPMHTPVYAHPQTCTHLDTHTHSDTHAHVHANTEFIVPTLLAVFPIL